MGKGSQSISIEGDDFLTWDLIAQDAKAYGYNTVSGYTQKLYKDSHNNLISNSRRNRMLKLALLLLLVLGWICAILLYLRLS